MCLGTIQSYDNSTRSARRARRGIETFCELSGKFLLRLYLV